MHTPNSTNETQLTFLVKFPFKENLIRGHKRVETYLHCLFKYRIRLAQIDLLISTIKHHFDDSV